MKIKKLLLGALSIAAVVSLASCHRNTPTNSTDVATSTQKPVVEPTTTVTPSTEETVVKPSTEETVVKPSTTTSPEETSTTTSPEETVEKKYVVFDTNGGSAIESIELDETGIVTRPADPAKDGYSFAGWYIDEEYTSEFDFTAICLETITIYAKWNQIPYISFDYDDGESAKIVYADENGYVAKPEDPTNLDNIFVGWFTSEDEIFNFNNPITSNISLIAKFRKKTMYDELITDDCNILKEEFASSVTLADFTDWGTKGLYQTISTKTGQETPSASECYITTNTGAAVLVDTSDNGGIQLIISSGSISSGIVEGYLETKLSNVGNSWTFLQMIGNNGTEIKEIFGLRTDSGLIKYRIDGGSAQAAETNITSSNSNYQIYYKYDISSKKLTVTINGNAFVTDLALDGTTFEGIKLVSSDSGSRTQTIDYIAINNMNYTLADYQAKLNAKLDAEYAAIDLSGDYSDYKSLFDTALANAKEAVSNSSDFSSAYTAYSAGVESLVAQRLQSAKTIYSNKLDTLVDASLYTENSEALALAITNGKEAIAAATTVTLVTTKYNTAVIEINSISDDSTYLNEYIALKISELKNYKLEARYTTNLEAYKNQISNSALNITNAGLDAENLQAAKLAVDQALANAKTKLDKIKDDGALALEEISKLYQQILLKLSSADAEVFDAIVAKLDSITETTTTAINAATDATIIANLLENAKTQMNNYYESATASLEATKNSAVTELTEYANSYANSYSDADLLAQIEDTKNDGIAAINAATDNFKALDELAAAKNTILETVIAFEKDATEEKIITVGEIAVSNYGGSNESAYVEFASVNDATAYNVYVKGPNYASYTLLDSKNLYISNTSTGVRADLLGLAAGSYSVKISPVVASAEKTATVLKVNVSEYDRSGYAHFNNSEGVGAYNNDGTLKDNAIVIYVSDATKNTVALTYNGKTVTGIGNILNTAGKMCGEVGHETECKKVSSGKTYYGLGNTNQGILADLAADNIPLVIRFVDLVSDSGLYEQGSWSATTASIIEGLTSYDCCDYGGSEGDNGHMARMKSAKNVTIEGVGNNAGLDGWGIHFMCESAYPEYGKSFEVRNLVFMNNPEDAIGMEGVQTSSTITASVERCWIHHNTFLAPSISNPAESDKSEGDGSCDFKRGQYFTLAYNYFEYCHKTNLIGSSDSSLQYNISMHHNIWYNCGSRIPLLRQANVHFYNNYIFGDSSDSKAALSYVTSLRANCYMYAEGNYYEGCKNIFDGKNGGTAKLYDNTFAVCLACDDALNYTTTDRELSVSSSCAYNGTSYANFDTNSTLFYYDSVNKKSDCYLTDSITARAECLKQSGSNYRTVLNKTVCQTGRTSNLYTPTEAVDLSSDTFTATFGTDKGIIYTNVKNNKFKSQGITFKLDTAATVTVELSATTTGMYPGYLIGSDGTVYLTDSGSVVLKAGIYYIASCVIDKETTVSALSFAKFNSAEFDQEAVDNANAKINQIPADITYTSACYNAIIEAKNAYEALNAELQAKVANSSKINTALTTYLSLGKAYVENLISEIGVVDQASGSAISSARTAYNEYKAISDSLTISNYSTLTAAEAAYQSYAITACSDAIDAIGTVTVSSGDAITAARSLYDSLTEQQKESITNYSTLTAAEKAYNDMIAAKSADTLIASVAEASSNYKEAIDAYNALTDDQKALITETASLSIIKKNYTSELILAIGTVTSSSGPAITLAREQYDSLTEEEKTGIDVDTLIAAETAFAGMVVEYTKSFSSTEGLTEKTGTTAEGFKYSAKKMESGAIRLKYSDSNYIELSDINGTDVVIKVTSKMADTSSATDCNLIVTYSDNSTETFTYNVVGSSATATEVEIKIDSSKTVLSIKLIGSITVSKNQTVSAVTVTYKA